MSRRSPTPVAGWQVEAGRPLWADDPDGMGEGKLSWVRASMAKLPDTEEQPHRSVVEMRIWGRYTFDEIANELGLSSRRNAHDLYHRAIGWLRDGRSFTIDDDSSDRFVVDIPGMREDADEWL